MNDKLSQEDIDKLLAGNSVDSGADEPAFLDALEADTIGEIGNISMGSAATTLSMLLGNKVEITTPRVEKYKAIDDILQVSKDYVAVEIKYKAGLDGTTIFALNVQDTAVIADLMMGGDGKVTNPEVGELQLSAVGEAMNQMMGTSSTALSSMFKIAIDITPPEVKLHKAGDTIDLANDVLFVPIVAVAFRLKVGDLIDSEFLQLMNVTSAKHQIDMLMNTMNPPAQKVAPVQEEKRVAQATPVQQASMSQNSAPPPPQNPVTVQPVQFASFDSSPAIYGESAKNLDILMDVKLKLTVELGKTELPIKKVLELTRGSVIELDKVAGEPVELFANGKLIAKGEVVVIEDNFGLRITSIVSPDNRVKSL